MGVVAHPTRTRFGRYRPWLLLGVPGLAAAAAAMFWVPPFGHTGRAIYALVIFTLFGVAYTVVDIPYMCLNAAMSGTEAGHTMLASARLFAAIVAGFVMYTAYPWMVDGLGDGAAGTQRAVAVTAAVATALLFLCFATTRETSPPPIASSLGASFREMTDALPGNRPLYVV